MPAAARFFNAKNAARRQSTETWCRSAVSFSFLFLLTASRMRTCAWDTAFRLCVRTVLCESAFPLVPPFPPSAPPQHKPRCSPTSAVLWVAPLLRIVHHGLRPPAFTVKDLHLLSPAGLPAHRSNPSWGRRRISSMNPSFHRSILSHSIL